MKCPICDNPMLNDICDVCRYRLYVEKDTFFKRIFSKKINKVSTFSDEISNLIKFLKFKNNIFSTEKYIARSEVKHIVESQKDNYIFFKRLNSSNDLFSYCKKYSFNIHNVTMYLELYEKFYDILKKRNDDYIKNKLISEKSYLDEILIDCDSKIKLDEEQRKVVLTDEDYNIVIAGAGAGKTTTVCAKVKYLVEKQNIDPKDILIISFTNKAVNELKERINKQLKIDCPIATFHSAGRAIILKDTKSSLSQIERDNFYIINKYLSELVLDDNNLLSKLVLLFGYYLDIPEEYLENVDIEEFFNYKERKDYSTLKSNIGEINQTIINARTKEQLTIKNEYLRSIQEVQIANFLYINNIEYEYEKPYKYKIPNARKIYTPDFYIKQGDNSCYIEHFGITENLEHNRYTKEELDKYILNMKFKISHHSTFGTELITTFSKYNDGRDLLEHLKEELIKKGFILTPKSDVEIYNKIKKHDQDKYITRFSILASRFIHLFKTRDYHEEDFMVLKNKTNNPRSILFLDILEKVYLYYQKTLKEKNAVDFEDMINESSRLLRDVESVQKQINFKYVIVDEYQDISRQRFNLVKAINKVCNAKIFVVGDDWQSIYAFSGSEVELFTKFKEEMGYAEILQITNTYRNSQELINIAGNFIQKNTSQIKKQLKSPKTIQKPVVIFTYSDIYNKNEKPGLPGVDYEKAKLLQDVIGKIIQVDGEDSKILLIGRYGFDAKKIEKTGLFYFEEKSNKFKSIKYPKVNLTFLTAHSSKGLTYNNVIIINAINSKFGFPSQVEDDPVLKFVIYEDSNYEYAEERRLFYVALTRTKNRVFILTPQTKPSKFVLELLNDYDCISLNGEIDTEYKNIKKRNKCPKCGYPMQLKQNLSYGLKLYICTNEPEACGFMTNDMRRPGNIYCCDKCDGIMIVKKSKEKEHYFMGCTNYRHDGKGCNNIEEITYED